MSVGDMVGWGWRAVSRNARKHARMYGQMNGWHGKGRDEDRDGDATDDDAAMVTVF